MARPPHFVQTAGVPLFSGQGTGELVCRCGESVLVRGYDPRNFLTVDFQCAACGQITTTPGLSALESPPGSVIGLKRIGETATTTTPIPPGAILAGQEEIDRLMALYEPRTPDSDEVTISATLLDDVAETYDRLTGGQLNAHLAALAAQGDTPHAGIRTYPLLWAMRHLQSCLGTPGWHTNIDDDASVASNFIGAFRHFNACWSHHPLFPMMAAAAADRGFSFHALAPYAAAKCIADGGNRVGFLAPLDGSGRVRDFHLATGPTDRLACVVDPFDRFEWPTGIAWDPQSIRTAVLDRLLASKARINSRHPGMLILSPGATYDVMEQPLVDAIRAALDSQGRRYRDLTAISVILPRNITTNDPHTIRFGYSFYPIPNQRHLTRATLRVGRPEDFRQPA